MSAYEGNCRTSGLFWAEDLVAAIARVAEVDELPSEPLGLAQPEPVRFRAILEALAAEDGRRPRFVRIPWRVLHVALRVAEPLPISLAFRSDSLLGLVRPAPLVPGAKALRRMGIHLRPFEQYAGGTAGDLTERG